MKTEAGGQLLQIYISESDRWEGRPLYEALVRAAREHGIAGATALRGIEGFGASSRIHTVKVLHLSESLPIVVEIVDRPDRIAAFMLTLDKMVREGMVTIQNVNTILYRQHGSDQPHADDDELQLESAGDAPVPPTALSSTNLMNEQALAVINVARQAAAHSRRPFIDSVDVLLALLAEPAGIAQRVLGELKIAVANVARCLREEVSRDSSDGEFPKALESKSATEARWLDDSQVGTAHVLLALCEIRPSAATDVLMRLGVQPRDICKEVLRILDHQDDWQRWLADHPDM